MSYPATTAVIERPAILPFDAAWIPTNQQLPIGRRFVMGRFMAGDAVCVGVLEFIGNEFVCEFRFAGRAVYCYQWLPIEFADTRRPTDEP